MEIEETREPPFTREKKAHIKRDNFAGGVRVFRLSSSRRKGGGTGRSLAKSKTSEKVADNEKQWMNSGGGELPGGREM